MLLLEEKTVTPTQKNFLSTQFMNYFVALGTSHIGAKDNKILRKLNSYQCCV